MLNEHTLDQLRSLRLDGMVRAIEEQTTSTAAAALGFDERLTLLVQREMAWRDGQAGGTPDEGRQAQGQFGLRGGHQLARESFAGPCSRCGAGRWRLAASCAESADHRRDGLRQDLAGARWRIRRRARASRCCTRAPRASSMSCRWRTATAASRVG